MPQINKNEKKLLLILGAAVFLVANGLGYVLISRAMGAIDREEARLNARLSSLNEAKSKSAEAEEKGAWIETHLLAYPNEGVRETYLDNLVTGDLTNGLDVEVFKNAPLTTITGEYFVKSRYRTNVKGPWPDVKEFLWRIQKPEEFRFIPKLNMIPRKSEEDDSVQLVEISLEIEKWWPKPSDFSGEETPAVEETVEQPATTAVETPAGENPPPVPPPDANPIPIPSPDGTPASSATPPPASTAETPPDSPTDPSKPNP